MTRPDDRQDSARTDPGVRQDAAPEGLTVAETSARLGVTPDAVRRRLHRGTLAGAKTADGEWRVWLPERAAPGADAGDRQDTARMPPAEAPVDLILVYEARLTGLREDLAFLRNELTARTEEIRRRDHIIAGLVERLPELPTGEDAPTTQRSATGATERTGAGSDTAAPWWRRWWRRMVEGP